MYPLEIKFLTNCLTNLLSVSTNVRYASAHILNIYFFIIIYSKSSPGAYLMRTTLIKLKLFGIYQKNRHQCKV